MRDESNKSKKTVRADNNTVVSSGVAPGGKTQKDVRSVISAGVVVAPTPTANIISSGIVSAGGGEVVLNNKTYKILKTISRSTGEAEVYLVESEKRKYVLKYYYPAFKPKDTILKQLKGLTHEDIIDLIDYGYYQDRFFEILEYAEGGTLMDINPDGTYRYIPIKNMQRLKQIIKEVVNALEFCHSRGIVHRDIKPENIFFTNPDGTDVQIGDFGISSILDEGLSKHLTGQARTEIYAAPELYQSIEGRTVISKEVDYYALGITLIHIFSGEEPFKGLSPYAIMKIKCDAKVDIPDDAPEELKTLIKGLITVEPSKRWGYKEVQKWLKGEYVPVYYKEVETRYGEFHFGFVEGEEIVINDPVELAKLLEKYPEQGKRHLYKGTIAKWVENVNQSLYVEIRRIVEDDYPTDQEAGLKKAIYVLDKLKNYKTFAGVECRTAEEIGDAIEQEDSYYRSYLTKKRNADLFLYMEARDAEDVADNFRKYAQAFSRERAFNLMVLQLQGNDRFKLGNLIFYKPEDLLAADDKIKDKFVQLLKNPNSKLSIWLEQFQELKAPIDKWRRLGRYNVQTLNYALDRDSSFFICGEKAKNYEEFESLLVKHISSLWKDLEPESTFIKEVEFWLKNYHNREFQITDIINIIQRIISTGISSDDMREKCERLCESYADYARTKMDRNLRTKIIELLKKINPGHKLVKIYSEEENLIKKLIEKGHQELDDTLKAELEKIEMDRKKKLEELERTRRAYKKSFWKGDMVPLFFKGIFVTGLWLWLIKNYNALSEDSVIGAWFIMGFLYLSRPIYRILTEEARKDKNWKYVGENWKYVGGCTSGCLSVMVISLIGRIVKAIFGKNLKLMLLIPVFLVSIEFIYSLNRARNYARIIREASNIGLESSIEKAYENSKQKVLKDIDEKRKEVEPQVVNKVYKMNSSEIENELSSLETAKSQ